MHLHLSSLFPHSTLSLMLSILLYDIRLLLSDTLHIKMHVVVVLVAVVTTHNH